MDRIEYYFLRHKHISAALLILLLALVFLNTVLVPAPDKVLGGYDMRGLFHVLTSTVSESIKEGSLPLWNSYLFNGFPLLSDPQAGVFYPPSWLSLILPVNVAISWYLLIHIWLAGFGMYAFVRYQGGRWLPSFLAGLVFAFGGVISGRLWAGHSIVYATFAWTPWILLGLSWSIKERSFWSAIISGVPVGLAILVGHLPSFGYILMIWAAYLTFLFITEKDRRLMVIRQATIALVVGAGLSAIQLIPSAQLTLLSQRTSVADYEFATRFSFPPAHLVTFIVPEFFGEPLRIGYWSVPTFEELTYYAGIVALIALIIALRKPDRLTLFYVVLIVFGILLAMGSYSFLHRVLYDVLPPIRYMRAPARAGFLLFFSSSALLGHSLSKWLNSPDELRNEVLGPTLRWIVVVFVVSGVVAVAAAGATFMSIHPTDTSGRLWHQIGGYSLALIVALLTCALLWVYLVRQPNRRPVVFLIPAALVAIVLIDLWTFSYKYVRTETTGPEKLWLDAKDIIGQTDSGILPWGIPIFSQNGGMQVGLRSVFGYNSLEPRDHLALASSIPDPRSTAYDVLGTEYVISESQLTQFDDGDSGLELLDNSDSVWVYRRPSALPVVRLVHQVEVIREKDQAISRIHDPEFDPGTTVILDQESACSSDSTASLADEVQILESRPGYWKIRSSSDAEGVLIIAENAYPGWRVTIDGRKAGPLTAYTSLRGVCLPAGEHIVEWEFVPTVIVIGAIITVVFILLVIAALVMIARSRKNVSEATG